jgi:hypothetical protein
VALARQELETALLQTASPANDATVKIKVAALRDAKVKAKEAVTKAQADLVKVLSIRQEGTLVDLGYLE